MILPDTAAVEREMLAHALFFAEITWIFLMVLFLVSGDKRK